jgi:hypothetical protein
MYAQSQLASFVGGLQNNLQTPVVSVQMWLERGNHLVIFYGRTVVFLYYTNLRAIVWDFF